MDGAAGPGPNTSTSRVVEYLPADVSEPADLVSQIRARRGGRLLNLDRMLLHSPELARGWSSLFGVIRSETKMRVSRRHRELAICAVAVLNEAEYEFYQHEPDWREAGATDEQVAAIRGIAAATREQPFQHASFGSTELLVAQLTLEMTRYVHASRSVMQSLKEALGAEARQAQQQGDGAGVAAAAAANSRDAGEAALVELVATISGYNMVSRFLVAMGVDAEGEEVS